MAFRIARFFALPIEAVFSDVPLAPLSEQVYRRRPDEPRLISPDVVLTREAGS